MVYSEFYVVQYFQNDWSLKDFATLSKSAFSIGPLGLDQQILISAVRLWTFIVVYKLIGML